MNKYVESEVVELKVKYTDSLVREIVSFLNNNGGTIYIGVNDDGTIVGVENTDTILRKISYCITNQIEPSPQGEISSKILYEDNKIVVSIDIQKGLKPIYCIKKYGFSSKGCLIRVGTSCKEMSQQEIQYRYKSQFIDDDFILMAPSKYFPLSFNMMKILLTGRGLHINDNVFDSTFNLKRKDGTYNLLAELLSDHNMVPMIFVKFAGKNKASISQRSDYGGQSILLGYQKLKDRLIAENICKTNTKVRPRIDEYLYNIDCVNEALVNMLVHNDWTITEPLVSFYEDRIVFTSHGGLPSGMSEEEFYNGVSHPRNSVLMRIFLTLGIVEHTGHGVSMITEKYGKNVFKIHQNYIDVTIPFNKNVLEVMPKNEKIEVSYVDLTGSEKKVIFALIKDPEATYNALADEIGLSRRTISRNVASLVEKKYIERVGNNMSGYWKVIK